jgi:MFS family permease
LWLPAGIGSRYYYGDEYGGFVMTNLPALPLMYLLNSRVNIQSLFTIAIVFNFVLIIVLGHLMDRLRVPRWSWLLFILLASIAILSGACIPGNIPPITPPPGARFHPVSVCPAWAGTLYLFAPGAMFVGFFSRTRPDQSS